MENKVVFITGGANGLGKAIVSLFCKNGADVVFCDIEEKASQELCKELSSYKCSYLLVDISDAKALEQAVEKVLEEKMP